MHAQGKKKANLKQVRKQRIFNHVASFWSHENFTCIIDNLCEWLWSCIIIICWVYLVCAERVIIVQEIDIKDA